MKIPGDEGVVTLPQYDGVATPSTVRELEGRLNSALVAYEEARAELEAAQRAFDAARWGLTVRMLERLDWRLGGRSD